MHTPCDTPRKDTVSFSNGLPLGLGDDFSEVTRRALARSRLSRATEKDTGVLNQEQRRAHGRDRGHALPGSVIVMSASPTMDVHRTRCVGRPRALGPLRFRSGHQSSLSSGSVCGVASESSSARRADKSKLLTGERVGVRRPWGHHDVLRIAPTGKPCQLGCSGIAIAGSSRAGTETSRRPCGRWRNGAHARSHPGSVGRSGPPTYA